MMWFDNPEEWARERDKLDARDELYEKGDPARMSTRYRGGTHIPKPIKVDRCFYDGDENDD
jgi:hypothetical protein